MQLILLEMFHKTKWREGDAKMTTESEFAE